MDRLRQEVAYIAYHFHWGRDEILDLDHKERHAWVQEISKINKKINKNTQSAGPSGAGAAAGAGRGGGFFFENPDA